MSSGGDMLGVSSLILGGIGAIQNEGKYNDALGLLNAQLSYLKSIGVPPIQAQTLLLQHYKSAGTLTPQLEETIKQGTTNLSKVALDPATRAAQMKALSQLSDIGSKGGMTLADEAGLQKAEIDLDARARGRRESVKDSFARRGMGGSAMELAADMQGAQDQSTLEAQKSLDTQASAKMRALDAIMKGGELAGSIRRDEYGQQKDAATAQDAIDRFNSANSQNVLDRNVGRQTDANRYNLTNAQRIQDENTQLDNQQQISNRGLAQRQYDNELKKAQLVQGAYTGQVAQINRGADTNSRMWGGLSQGVGQLGAQMDSDDRFDRYMKRRYPTDDDDEEEG